MSCGGPGRLCSGTQLHVTAKEVETHDDDVESWGRVRRTARPGTRRPCASHSFALFLMLAGLLNNASAPAPPVVYLIFTYLKIIP